MVVRRLIRQARRWRGVGVLRRVSGTGRKARMALMMPATISAPEMAATRVIIGVLEPAAGGEVAVVVEAVLGGAARVA